MILSVDIGTSYSASCVLGPDGQAHPVEVSTGASMFGGQFSLPSAVFVEENGDILVGQAAMNSRKRKPENFRMEFKRNFGETYPILLGNRSFLPEELYALLLRHIKTCAEKVSGEAVELTYLTHPASYGKARIEKLCAAARAAGLFDVETVDEPTAAAMSYCAAGYIQDGQTLLVYDFGGGTFDVSLIRYENGVFTLLGDPEGLEQCGGIDMDRLIYQDMLRAVDPDTLSKLQTNHLYFMQFTSQLAELAVKAKHHLSAAKVFEEPIIVGFETISYRLTVERFNQMIAPLVGQTITTCHLALKKADLTCADLSAVLLVGGTSRVPLVQEMVRQFAGKVPVHCAPDLELAVAQGAINYRQFQKRSDEPTPEDIQAWYEQGLRMIAEDKWEEAVIWFSKAAEHGNIDAQNQLADCYEHGYGVDQNPELAIYWYTQAAEQGDAAAQFYLGTFYDEGELVEQNPELAVYWYTQAAERGHGDAQNNLACCYDEGRGVEQSYKKAVEWYRRAAEQGFADAQYNLGVSYEHGQGVEQNYEQAVYWYHRAGKQDHIDALFNLGLCYDEGIGTEQDQAQAIRCYRHAAEYGHSGAQHNLGVCFFEGNGVSKEPKEAVRWFTKAADQGDPDSMFMLGHCCETGQGIAKNLDEASQWYRKASENGYEDLEEAKKALERLAKEQVDKFVWPDGKAFVASTIRNVVSVYPVLEKMWKDLSSDTNKLKKLYKRTKTPGYEEILFGFVDITGGFALTENGVYSCNLWEHHTFTWKEFLSFKVKIDYDKNDSKTIAKTISCVSIDRGSGGNACVCAGNDQITGAMAGVWTFLQSNFQRNRHLL